MTSAEEPSSNCRWRRHTTIKELDLPRLSRWFIRTAMGYLMAAFIAGVLQVLPTAWDIVLWPTYLHLLVVGWLSQLIFGVAFWMFPRHSPQAPRGSERLGWTCYWLLNTGLLLRVIGEPRRILAGWSNWLLLAAALLQLAAGWAFVLNTWPRIKER